MASEATRLISIKVMMSSIYSSALGYTSHLQRNLGNYEQSYNHQSAGSQSGKYSNSFQYSYPWWSYGQDYSRSYDYEWNNLYDYATSGSWSDNEYSLLLNTGVAKGVADSTVDTGKGDDSISVTAMASSKQQQLKTP